MSNPFLDEIPECYISEEMQVRIELEKTYNILYKYYNKLFDMSKEELAIKMNKFSENKLLELANE